MSGSSTKTSASPTMAVVVARAENALLRAGGRTILGRSIEMLRRAGAAPVAVVCEDGITARVRAEVDALAGACQVVPASDARAVGHLIDLAGERLLAVEGDVLYDPRLVSEAVAWTRPTVLVDSAPEQCRHPQLAIDQAAFAGLASFRPADLAAALASRTSCLDRAAVSAAVADLTRCDVVDLPLYSRALRRELRPFWLPIVDRDDIRRARKILAAAAGKGHMEWCVVLFNRPTEQLLAYYLAEWRITPNQITLLSNITAYGATALFALGMLWSALGLVVATGILDGLDGRQARIQIKTSKVGEWEHVFDAISEVSWMVATCWWFSDGLEDTLYVWACLAWCVFYALDNYSYTFFRLRRGMIIDEASGVDAAIRFVASRRNTNFAYFAIALALGYPAQGLLIVVGFHGLSALVHWLRVAMLLSRPTGEVGAQTVDR